MTAADSSSAGANRPTSSKGRRKSSNRRLLTPYLQSRHNSQRLSVVRQFATFIPQILVMQSMKCPGTQSPYSYLDLPVKSMIH